MEDALSLTIWKASSGVLLSSSMLQIQHELLKQMPRLPAAARNK